jgi:hypothetical protein
MAMKSRRLLTTIQLGTCTGIMSHISNQRDFANPAFLCPRFNSQPNFFRFDVQARSQDRLASIEAEMKEHANNDPLK